MYPQGVGGTQVPKSQMQADHACEAQVRLPVWFSVPRPGDRAGHLVADHLGQEALGVEVAPDEVQLRGLARRELVAGDRHPLVDRRIELLVAPRTLLAVRRA